MANTCNGDRPAFQVIVHSNAQNGEIATWESKHHSITIAASAQSLFAPSGVCGKVDNTR
jgi:hypothetical protein